MVQFDITTYFVVVVAVTIVVVIVFVYVALVVCITRNKNPAKRGDIQWTKCNHKNTLIDSTTLHLKSMIIIIYHRI